MSKVEKYLVIHGPNLNLLGSREPNIYGKITLEQINDKLLCEANKLCINLEIIQSNNEGDIIDTIHKNTNVTGIIINPAAYTHYSIAIYDAIKAINIPTVEVHISNIHSREEFRRNSVIAGACIGQISGFGYMSYILALKALVNYNKD